MTIYNRFAWPHSTRWRAMHPVRASVDCTRTILYIIHFAHLQMMVNYKQLFKL